MGRFSASLKFCQIPRQYQNFAENGKFCSSARNSAARRKLGPSGYHETGQHKIGDRQACWTATPGQRETLYSVLQSVIFASLLVFPFAEQQIFAFTVEGLVGFKCTACCYRAPFILDLEHEFRYLTELIYV